MKTIVAALDYHASAEKVAATAFSLSKALGAEIVFLHVITEPVYYSLEYSPILGLQGGFAEQVAGMGQEIHATAESFLQEIVHKLGEEEASTVVLEGDIEEAILGYADRINAGLIVMGSHRHHGLDRAFVPDLAVHLLKHSRIPLLAIPTGNDNG